MIFKVNVRVKKTMLTQKFLDHRGERQLPRRFTYFELTNGAEICDEGELIHFATMDEFETLDFNATLREKVWREAMREELSSIEKNQPSELTKLSLDKRAIDVKWVFNLKQKYSKVRLIARGVLQRKGLHYSEVLSPGLKGVHLHFPTKGEKSKLSTLTTHLYLEN